MDPDAFNYNVQANVNDNSCEPIVYGCMDPFAFNYNPQANTQNILCIPVTYGCIDEGAYNYNLNANTDDGSCIYAPDGWSFNQSTLQAFYFIADADIDGAPISDGAASNITGPSCPLKPDTALFRHGATEENGSDSSSCFMVSACIRGFKSPSDSNYEKTSWIDLKFSLDH